MDLCHLEPFGGAQDKRDRSRTKPLQGSYSPTPFSPVCGKIVGRPVTKVGFHLPL